MTHNEKPKSQLSRRSILGAAAWTAPVIALSAASPATAASTTTPTIEFLSIPADVEPGATYGDLIIHATIDGITPAPVGAIITVTLSEGSTSFADGSVIKEFAASGTVPSVAVSGIVSTSTTSSTFAYPVVAIYSTAHAAGFLHVLPAKSGTLVGWGYNGQGQAGRGGTATRPLEWLGTEKYTSIYGGYSHFAAVTTSGTVFMTGNNGSGPFGATTPAASGATGPVGPALNASLTGPFTNAARVVDTQGMYDQTTWIIGKDGLIYACGENSSDMFSLKDGTANGAADNPKGGLKPVGTQILAANPGKSIVWASGNGWYRAAYLLSDGTVWNSGSNNYFGMGNNGTKGTQYLAAQTVKSDGRPLTGITQVRVTQDASMYLDGDGIIWGAGTNTHAQLPGLGATSATAKTAVPLTQPDGKKVSQIWANAADSESFFARTTDGVVYAVGANLTGNASVGHASSLTEWTRVIIPDGKTLATIGGGGNGNVFLMTDGSVYFAGANDVGGLGNGTTGGNITTMTQVPLPRRAIAVAATWYDSYAAILED